MNFPRRNCAAVEVVEIDYVRAVEVRVAIAGAKIEWIVAVVKEAHRALLVGRVRVGIGEADLEAVTQALFDVGLQGVVSRDAGRSIGFGFGGIADVGNAEVDIAAFKCLLIRLAAVG